MKLTPPPSGGPLKKSKAQRGQSKVNAYLGNQKLIQSIIKAFGKASLK
jgi:hypothetical protein